MRYVNEINSSHIFVFGFWYFGHFSCRFSFCPSFLEKCKQRLCNFCNLVAKSDQKRKTKNWMTETYATFILRQSFLDIYCFDHGNVNLHCRSSHTKGIYTIVFRQLWSCRLICWQTVCKYLPLCKLWIMNNQIPFFCANHCQIFIFFSISWYQRNMISQRQQLVKAAISTQTIHNPSIFCARVGKLICCAAV